MTLFIHMLVKPGSNAWKSWSFTSEDNPDPGVFKQFGLPIWKQLSVLLHSPLKCTDPLQNYEWPQRSRSWWSCIQSGATHNLRWPTTPPEPQGNLLSRAESVPHWPQPFSAYELGMPSRCYVSSFAKPFQQIMANCYQIIMVGLNNCAINRGNRAPTTWKPSDFGAIGSTAWLRTIGWTIKRRSGSHGQREVDWSLTWGCLPKQNLMVLGGLQSHLPEKPMPNHHFWISAFHDRIPSHHG